MVLLALNYLSLGSLFFSFYKEIACSFILFSFKLSLFTLAYFRLLGFYFFSFFICVSSTCKNLLEALQWIISNSAVWKKILISIYYPPPPLPPPQLRNWLKVPTPPPITITTLQPPWQSQPHPPSAMLDPKHYSELHGKEILVVMQELNENLPGTTKHNVINIMTES